MVSCTPSNTNKPPHYVSFVAFDQTGRIFTQQLDANARTFPNGYGLFGGNIEPEDHPQPATPPAELQQEAADRNLPLGELLRQLYSATADVDTDVIARNAFIREVCVEEIPGFLQHFSLEADILDVTPDPLRCPHPLTQVDGHKYQLRSVFLLTRLMPNPHPFGPDGILEGAGAEFLTRQQLLDLEHKGIASPRIRMCWDACIAFANNPQYRSYLRHLAETHQMDVYRQLLTSQPLAA